MGTDDGSLPLFRRGGVLIGERGGEAEHTLTVAEMPQHTHPFPGQMYWGEKFGKGTTSWGMNDTQTSQPFNLYETGGSQPHNNMPPYIGVCAWRRIE